MLVGWRSSGTQVANCHFLPVTPKSACLDMFFLRLPIFAALAWLWDWLLLFWKSVGEEERGCTFRYAEYHFPYFKSVISSSFSFIPGIFKHRASGLISQKHPLCCKYWGGVGLQGMDGDWGIWLAYTNFQTIPLLLLLLHTHTLIYLTLCLLRYLALPSPEHFQFCGQITHFSLVFPSTGIPPS